MQDSEEGRGAVLCTDTVTGPARVINRALFLILHRGQIPSLCNKKDDTIGGFLIDIAALAAGYSCISHARTALIAARRETAGKDRKSQIRLE